MWFLLLLLLIPGLAHADCAAEARKLLRPPAGSLSLGRTNAGTLDNGVEMPLKGRGYAFFPVIAKRRTNFATSEMARMIRRASRIVARRHKGAVVGIGNITVEGGGQTGDSVSHKSGRDADLGIFALDRQGRPVNLRAFIGFEEDGWDRRKRFQFDDRRNLTLIKALLTDPQAHVQWIFIAEWLKKRIIARAWEEAVDPAIIEKMELVLQQPSDSNPHQDHYHVRIYCAVDDRLHGCLERGPIHPGIDLGDAAVRERAQALTDALACAGRRYTAPLTEALAVLHEPTALPTLFSLAAHAQKNVRSAALDGIRRLGLPEAVPPLAELLSRTRHARDAEALLRVIAAIESPKAVDLAHAVLTAPDTVLGRPPTAPMVRTATDVLGYAGSKSHVPALIDTLERGPRAARGAVHDALRRLTNASIPRRRGAAAWRGFWREHGAKSQAAWRLRGFVTAGYNLGPAFGWEDVPMLIRALRDRDPILGENASWALTAITGHPVDPRHRSARNTWRHWRWWLGLLNAFIAPESEERSPRKAPTT